MWDSESETTEEDVVMDQLFKAAEDDSDSDDDRKKTKKTKSKGKKRKGSSSSDEAGSTVSAILVVQLICLLASAFGVVPFFMHAQGTGTGIIILHVFKPGPPFIPGTST